MVGNHMCGLCDDALPTEELAALTHDVLSPQRLGPHQLSDAFGGARGFSVVFTQLGIPSLLAELPGLGAYVRLALRPSCNAFYLNPLVIEDGGRVDAHVDSSLSPLAGQRVTPVLVSVLYLEVPPLPAGNGELVLTEIADGRPRSMRVPPRVNRLVMFRGDLEHEVTPGANGARRSSLVCEQYRLPPDQLARIPAFRTMGVA
jgi:hypothetical protein